MNGRRGNHGPPPGLTGEERREWWERQRRKYVWGAGDIKITERGDGKRPKEDGAGTISGR